MSLREFYLRIYISHLSYCSDKIADKINLKKQGLVSIHGLRMDIVCHVGQGIPARERETINHIISVVRNINIKEKSLLLPQRK